MKRQLGRAVIEWRDDGKVYVHAGPVTGVGNTFSEALSNCKRRAVGVMSLLRPLEGLSR